MGSRVALIALYFATACSGSTLEPGAGNDPGTETDMILARGTVVARPLHPNARASSEFTTEFRVEVFHEGPWASDAAVTVTSATGKVALRYSSDGHVATWTGSAPGYDEVYVLDIVNGGPWLEGARVDGPDIHVFTQPAAGTVVDPELPLQFAWDRDDRADYALMEIDSSIAMAVQDTGEYALGARVFAIADPHATVHTVRLERSNSVRLRSGLSWGAIVVNEIDVMTPDAQ